MSTPTGPEGTLVKEYQVTGIDGTIYTFQVWLTKVETQEPPPPPPDDCPEGQHRDPTTGECVPNVPPPPPPPPPPTELEEIPIVSATSNRDDGNVASNVISPDVARWSCQGTDCELLLDLGHVNEVGEVFITFFRGGERTENFEVGFSEDNVNYIFVPESQQDAANAIIKISPLIKARYIKFRGKGNNSNEWNSVEYVKISGKKLPPPPPPEPCPPQTCPSGQHWDPIQCKCVPDSPPPPPPPPPGGSTTRDGVTVPFTIKGEWDYEYETDERDGGARYNMNAAGTSLVMVGYFTMSGGSDDVAGKVLGGRHTDSAEYDGCIYDPAIQTDNGEPRLRCECPHPDYTDNLDLDFEQQGVSYHDRWVGTMVAAIQETNGVRIQMFQDQGDNEGDTPANQWVKVLEFFDDGSKVSGIEGADRYPLRTIPDSAQNTWRIDESPGLIEKWLAIAELDVSGTQPPPPPPPPGDCPPGQHRDPITGECVPNTPPPPPPPGDQLGPYPSTGRQIEMDIDDEAGTRHYASGKEDDRTIEAEADGIDYDNYQVITEVTMKDVEHDDQVSHKLGGTHTGTGWFDHTVSFEEGECCLGKEEDHPSTDLCVESGASIGNILHKPLKMATVYRRQTNHTELWTDFEGSGWVKQMEATDLGGFNPGSDEDEALLRIDGFSEGGSAPGEGNVPTISLAVVQEIASIVATATTARATKATSSKGKGKGKSKSKSKIKSKSVECGTE